MEEKYCESKSSLILQTNMLTTETGVRIDLGKEIEKAIKLHDGMLKLLDSKMFPRGGAVYFAELLDLSTSLIDDLIMIKEDRL